MIKRNTKQKRIVIDTLGRMNHPSATAVYEEVRRRDPAVSRSTVFRVLADAAEEGMLRRLKIPGTDDRFDATLIKHSHILCRSCGRVDDVKIAGSVLRSVKALGEAGARGYKIEECRVEFIGLCPDCAALLKKEYLQKNKKTEEKENGTQGIKN